jgi:peptide subunit release factor 1 (eRF1)
VRVLPIERDLLQIERFCHPQGGPTLSVYLETLPSWGAGSNPKAQLEAVLRPIRATLEGPALDQLDSAAAMVMKAIARLDHLPRAVAAFACPDVGFLRIVPLPEPVVPAAYWGPTLHLKELLAAMDEHERTVVVLVDREHARVYRIFMGQIEEVASLDRKLDPAQEHGTHQKKSRSGGQGSPIRMDYGERNTERRQEWHVRRHLERVLTAVRDRDSPAPDRVLVGGGKDTVHELLALMPPRIRARTRLISGLPVSASRAEVLGRVMEALDRAEREAEEELLDNLMERDRAHAVFGTASVVEAVSDAHVHTLVYGVDASVQGSECDACGWLMNAPPSAACPRCGGPMHAVAELVERMVHRVLETGGRVEEVRGPASRTLGQWEGLAALLRYQPSTNGHSTASRS